MSTITRLLTAEDLWQLPADGNFHELVRGEIRTMPPAGFEHGVVGTNLALCLGPHIKLHRLGLLTNADTGFLLHRNPDTVRAPDIGFVRQERVSGNRHSGQVLARSAGLGRGSRIAERPGL